MLSLCPRRRITGDPTQSAAHLPDSVFLSEGIIIL